MKLILIPILAALLAVAAVKYYVDHAVSTKCEPAPFSKPFLRKMT